MSVLVYGLNHKTAPLELRERVAFAKHSLPQTLQQAQADLDLPEVAILSTCNRTEIYCHFASSKPPKPQAQQIGSWMADFHNLDRQVIMPACYHHHDEQAVRHVIRVASGLDSMVLGEPQIMGQMKVAYATALASATTGPVLNQLNQHSMSAAKRIRSETNIGRNPVTIPYAILSLVRRIFADVSNCTALLVGVSEITELVAQHLTTAGVSQLTIANRTLANAQDFAKKFGAQAVALGDLREHLSKTDIVIACTGSQIALVGKGMVEEALKKRKFKPIFMADLAVPRDIEPETGQLEDIYLYTIDDLRGLIEQNSHARIEAAQTAEHMVNEAASNFISYLQGRSAINIIRGMRAQLESLVSEELKKSKARLAKGEDAEQVTERMARALVNRWLHNPTTRLRQTLPEGRAELLNAACQLYDLDINTQSDDTE